VARNETKVLKVAGLIVYIQRAEAMVSNIESASKPLEVFKEVRARH